MLISFGNCIVEFKSDRVSIDDILQFQLSLTKNQTFAIQINAPLNSTVEMHFYSPLKQSKKLTFKISDKEIFLNWHTDGKEDLINTLMVRNHSVFHDSMHFKVREVVIRNKNKFNFPNEWLSFNYFQVRVDISDQPDRESMHLLKNYTIAMSDGFLGIEIDQCKKQSLNEFSLEYHPIILLWLWSWVSSIIIIFGYFYNRFKIFKNYVHIATACILASIGGINFGFWFALVKMDKFEDPIKSLHKALGIDIWIILSFQIIAGVTAKIIRKSRIKDSEDYLFILRLFHQYGGLYLAVSSNISILSMLPKLSPNTRFLMIIHYAMVLVAFVTLAVWWQFFRIKILSKICQSHRIL